MSLHWFVYYLAVAYSRLDRFVLSLLVIIFQYYPLSNITEFINPEQLSAVNKIKLGHFVECLLRRGYLGI